MQQKTPTLIELTKRRSLVPEAPHAYVAGFLGAFIAHLERTVPGVKEAIATEIQRLEREKI